MTNMQAEAILVSGALRVTTTVLILVALLACAAAHAQGEASAPWLGNEKYTVDLAGPLPDVIKELKQITGRYIQVPYVRTDTGMAQFGAEIPIVLQFTDAPLSEIMLSVCEQSGTVYDTHASPNISLREGNTELDARPTATLDDYTVRVRDVTVSSSRRLECKWGRAEPGEPTYHDNVTLGLAVTARTKEAYRRLAGVEAYAKALTDTGDTLEGLKSDPPQILYSHQWARGAGSDQTSSLHLPPPPEGAVSITRLEGTLRLFKQVKANAIEIEPQEGAAFGQDDVSGAVESWNRTGQQLSVSLAYQHDRPPKATIHMPFVTDIRRALLVGLDGKQVTPSGMSYSGSPTRFVASLTFNLPSEDFEADHLLYTLIRRSEPTETVPFVLQDVPLP